MTGNHAALVAAAREVVEAWDMPEPQRLTVWREREAALRAALATAPAPLDVDALRQRVQETLDYAERLDMLWMEKYDELKRTLAATPAPLDVGITQRAHVVCCWCGEHHEEGI